MKRFALPLWGMALYLLSAISANAQGTLPIALTQNFSFVGCSTAANVCGTPLINGQLSFFQVGTTATRQDSFQDPGLTILNPWPLTLDANGRVPMFYLASGSVHVRLTDAAGVVQFDYPSMLVIGPSGGGSGSSYTPPPGSQFATGDIKFRLTGDDQRTAWIKLNGQTLGNATSGANNASPDYQALFVYLYANCPDAVCTVPTRTGNAVNDFNGSKKLTLPDLRARTLVGLDDMGAAAAGILNTVNFNTGFSGPVGATGTTLFAKGGEPWHTLSQAELPIVNWPITEPNSGQGHQHGYTVNVSPSGATAGGAGFISQAASSTSFATTGITVGSGGSGFFHNVMAPFVLGSFYIKS